MKKIKTFFIAALLGAYMNVWADNGVLLLRAPKPEGCSVQVAYPSSNGAWATGGVYDGSTYQAYRWNTRDNEFEYLNTYGDFSFGYSVSNNGMVAGEYTTHELLQNGAGIQSPCVWYDGKWHVLDLGTVGTIDPEQASIGAARHITPDGKHVVGALCTSKGWQACTWQLDDKAQSTVSMLPLEEFGVAEHVSDDGSIIGGFDEAGSIRIPAYWKRLQNGKYGEVIPDGRKHSGMWTITSGVSPDGTYVASWNKLFNLKTGSSIQFDANTNVDAATVAGVTSAGIVYGAGLVMTNEGLKQFAAFYQDGKWYDLQPWLEERGAKFGTDYRLSELRYMSDDGKVFFVNITCSDGLTGVLMIRLDENVTSRPPVALKAVQMGGLKAVRLTWKEPLANAEGVKEYALLRDGAEIFRGKALQYTDRTCDFGKTYTYTVRAIYDGVTSEDSAPVVTTTSASPLSGPSAVNASQTGINNVRLTWDAAGTNLSELKYYTDGHEVSAFGGGSWNIEAGVRFRHEDLMLYEGMQVNEVSFWPMSPQKEWKISFYNASDMKTPIYSETLDASTLNYGSQNTIRLKTPVQIPESGDLVVGVCAMLSSSSFNVIGLMQSDNDPGYTDLIRQPGEDFVSLYEDGLKNGYEYPYSWPISLGLATVGGDISSLEGYNIYQNGEKLAMVDAKTLKYVQTDVADGNYSYAVSAVYSNGNESAAMTTDVSVKRDTRYYRVDEITTKPAGSNTLEAIVEWRAPMDDERTTLTYSKETMHHGVHTSAAEGYSFQAAAIYNQPMFKQFLGDYQISGVRFYPVGNAEFALYLNESGKNRWSIELERGVDYELGKWNTIRFDKPIPLDATVSELQLIIDCFDGDAGCDILAMDDMPANPNFSDLYSLDDGASWDSYESQTGMRGNWMIGLLITAREQKALPVKSYVLKWDGNADDLTTVPADGPLSVKHVFGATHESAHKVVITAVYDNDEAWPSLPCPITWMKELTPVVEVKADAGSVAEVYDLSGRKVECRKSQLMKGIYIKNGKKVVNP